MVDIIKRGILMMQINGGNPYCGDRKHENPDCGQHQYNTEFPIVEIIDKGIMMVEIIIL